MTDWEKRHAAIDRAEREGTHSARQIAEARKELETFTAYPQQRRAWVKP